MANDNQNNQDHSDSSFKEQILRSMRVDGSEDDHMSSSGNEYQNQSEEHSQVNTSGSSDWESNQQEAPQSYSRVEASQGFEQQPINNSNDDEQHRTSENKDNRADSFKRTRKKEDRLVNRIVLLVISVLILVIAIFGFTFYKYVDEGLQPLDKNDNNLVQVYIPAGSSNKQIAAILEENKVIKSGMVFNYYIKFKNLADFQAGYYQMSPNMTLDEVGGLLREGGTAEPMQIADGKVTVPEGYDIDKIGDAIKENTDYKKDDFIALMQNEDYFNAMLAKYPDLLGSAAEAEGVRYRLEGYLFPATYDYYKDVSLEDFVDQMIAKTDSVIGEYAAAVNAKGMTNQQVLTLASLVEKEGVEESDRRKIAQVFFNRIAANMPLQSDISILYALGEHKELVTYKDLEVDSPYNLYRNTGYGPGPMDSPSEQAIAAVLNPEENSYFYFVADIKTGKVYFAETYEEHQEFVDKYVNNSTEKSD
ncbi:endolytic transglycosylase MltG [Enterococcus sp. BWT-B8]|uniref:endolytic transglycosylase MltG n=1 Tax=unclassified Enterococcus TaxID=2608891 RepID=UPI001E36C7F6|nr:MULTISPECIES: endolytic transglycosylase MltG [unclassified Enterococcus]MCB5951562.1 endolytic transglycosylase MltG [Enterococcus sp. BWT-B8]MCB5954654.1 endolytic transglycosylase MltG [Enterococcus sp. CWB-B31]